MPRGSKPGEHRGGRKKGSPNKKTLEALERRRVLAENAEKAEAEKAALVAESAKVAKLKLGKDVLEEFMMLFAGMAAFYQPHPEWRPRLDTDGKPVLDNGRPVLENANPNMSEPQFLRYAVLARDTAKDLAPYQSPTFRAIVVAPAPDHDKSDRRRFTLNVFEYSTLTAPPQEALTAPKAP